MTEADEFGPGGMYDDSHEKFFGKVERIHGARPVLPSGEMHDWFTLCRITGKRVDDGFCIDHQTDACLSLFCRCNFMLETMEQEIDEARLRVRNRVG